MEEILKLLDDSLQYLGYKVNEKTIEIMAKSKREEAECPYCGTSSTKIHSRVKRTLKDLPIQGRKVKIILEANKYFCQNQACTHKTFAERFRFFESRATRTNRLQEEIIHVSLTQSSLSASRHLRASVADVGKSSICNMLKKGHQKRC